jgi:NAD(P)-dependent dehydrogenase (short-subunit alcohol dehydrogenase family)
VSDQASVEAGLAGLPELDVLVNNAGILGTAYGADDLDAEAMAAVLDTNVTGIVRVTQAALPLRRRWSNPVIVNVASGVGLPRYRQDPEHDEYPVQAVPCAASKAAVIAQTVQYAKKPQGNASQCVGPGLHRDRLQPP